jgi:amicyanin
MPAAAAASATNVRMANYAFSPASLTVTAGDTVTWTNTDQAPHDVTTTSAPVSIHSPMLSKGQSWSYTFSTPGTYAYICSIHPDMKATVIVRPRPTAAAPTTAAPTTTAPTTTATATVAPAPRATSRRATRASHRASQRRSQSSSQAAAARVSAAPTNSPAGQATAANAPAAPSLRPLLLLTGLVAAVATFCLLLLASRPEST